MARGVQVPEAGGGGIAATGNGETPADEFGAFLEDLTRELESSLQGQGGESGEEPHAGPRGEAAAGERSIFLDPARVALDWVGAVNRLRFRRSAG
jgi:hypothetical protein